MARISIHMLLVALVLVLIHTDAQSGSFTITSEETNACIANVDVTPGEPVQLGSDNCLTLTIDPSPESAAITTSSIYDEQSGLYVGAEEDIPGSKVVWVPDEYKWQVARTSRGPYVIYPIGPDIFWATSSTISPNIKLILGLEIRGQERLWSLNELKA